MRYWLSSAVIILFTVATAESQDKKKDDAGKEPKVKETVVEFAGKTYDQWRKELKSTDPSKRETAMKAVLMFDLAKATEAMPELIADLARQKTIPVDLSVRVNGTMALNTYFLHAAKASKKVDEKIVEDALAIYRMGLKDPQVIMKVRSLQGLQYLGPTARKALPEVIPLTRDTSTWEVRKEAIPMMVMLAFNEKGTVDGKVMLALKNSADMKLESSYMVRVVAVSGLGILGRESYLVDLNRALKGDISKEVRMAAAQAMIHAKEKAMPALKDAIKDQPNTEIRVTAVQAYGAAGKDLAVPELLKYLNDPEKEVRLAVLTTLAALKDAMTDISKAATKKAIGARISFEKDPIVHTGANMAIMMINGKCDKQHIQPILNRLSDKETTVRVQAFQAIVTCGIEARGFAVDPLLEIVSGKDADLAVSAIETLVFIQAYDAAPMLKKIMQDPKASQDLKYAAETALDNFELMKAKEKKEKSKEKTPEKK